jgi:hypothetical protein
MVVTSPQRLVEKGNLHCRPHPQPLSFVRRGEHGTHHNLPPKAKTRKDAIVTYAVAPSPYEGEGWGGVSQDEKLSTHIQRPFKRPLKKLYE